MHSAVSTGLKEAPLELNLRYKKQRTLSGPRVYRRACRNGSETKRTVPVETSIYRVSGYLDIMTYETFHEFLLNDDL